jgi:leader peptidase (prepilin peptidase)/N-methyltransferase
VRESFLSVVAALSGAVVGSFLNVVVWRLPRGESLSRPRSRCPRCGALIRWFDNVPVLSWLLLRARCRGCRAPISARYPFVEALTAALFLLAWWRWEPDVLTAVLVALALASLVAISFIDLDHRIIPDKITKPGMVLAVAVAPWMATHPRGWIESLSPAMGAWAHAVAGLLLGLLVILGIRVLGRLAFKKEAMGLGDAKLLAFLGALTGPLGVLYSVVIGSLLGAVIGIVIFVVARGRPQACAGTAEGKVEGRTVRHAFDRVRFRKERLWVPGTPDGAAGTDVRVDLVLPAMKVLEEEDAKVRLRAKVEAVEPGPGGPWWLLELADVSEEDAARLEMFTQSHRYVPFGPFLSLGGALALLYAEQVHWVITEWYPRHVRGLVAALVTVAQ